MLIKNKRAKPVLPVITALIALGAALLMWQTAFKSYGHLQLRAVDAYTLAPLEGASVAVAEFGLRATTDHSGYARFTGIPLRSWASGRLPQNDRGECTVVAATEGYRPTVLLHAQVYKNRMRRATLYMFPVETDEAEIIAITESPDEAWLKQLIEEYGN